MKATSLTTRQKLNRIYKDICGFEIPKDDEKSVKKSKGSPVYGEINFAALEKLLKFLKLGPKDVFYDLGSGVGKVVLQTAISTKAQASIGVELSTSRYLGAQEALNRALEYDKHLAKRVSFLNLDLMKADLSNATVIYTCSTAFSQAFFSKVAVALSKFKQPFKLVSLQELPSARHFEHLHTMKLDMSWMRNTDVYIYQRKTP